MSVIVTGASRGIGLSIVKSLLEKSVNVVGISRSDPGVKHDKFTFIQGDICDVQVQKRSLEAAGNVQALIHNAGVLPLSRMADFDANEWKRAMDINVYAPLQFTAFALKHLQEGARVIFVSSGAAVSGYEGWGAYCSTKAALLLAGKCLAKEQPDLLVLSIRPGVVDTEMQAQIRTSGSSMGNDLEKFIQLKETGKLLSPDVVGKRIATIALNTGLSQQLSGELINWDDPKLLLTK